MNTDVDYEQLDTGQLRKLAQELRYDSNHKMEEVKREQAKNELMKVEAEIENREGFRGLFRQFRKLINSRS